MDVPYETVTSCSLATREDAGEANAHLFSFRKLHDKSQKDEMSQALAQRVIAELTVTTGQVRLHIKDFNDATDHPITLLAGSAGYKIDFANEPDFPLERDSPCDDGVARHFAMFYDLAQNPPDVAQRMLPHVRFTQSKNEKSLRPPVCDDPTFALFDRPICPMASFNP
jgi:hypothetical protein